MGFQSQVNLYPAPGVEGARASNNVATCVVAGPGGLVAGAAGARVGAFAWNTAGVANSYCYTALVPDGFVSNEQQALITTWLADSTQLVAPYTPVTEYDRGDFWARSVFTESTIGQKVYANVLTGRIYTAATAAFPVTPAGTTGTITASTSVLGVMTPTAGSIYLAPGMLVTGPGYPVGTYINSQVTGAAGACSSATYQLTTLPPVALASSTVVVCTTEDLGGSTTSSCSCSQSSATLTVTTRTNGNIYKGQRVSGTYIPTGTYVSALVTYNDALGTGTLTLSAVATDTISGAAILFSPWIETPWYVKSAGNVGDLIKIGIRN